MDRIRITGGRPLHGRVRIAGAKNAALPLLAVCLLSDEAVILENLPAVEDIATMAKLLDQLGVAVSPGTPGPDQAGKNRADPNPPESLVVQAERVLDPTAPYDLVRKMRASILVLGPLLARLGRARVSLPGGCAIGPRPVDLHIKGLEQMGARITLRDGYVDAEAPRGLKGAHIAFPSVSVGATENLMMAATLADGETTLTNAAREPEIEDLARCLSRMGARIQGVGTEVITIQGVSRLSGTRHRVLPDRIETGTYAIAAAITGGELELENTEIGLIDALAEKLQDAGVALVAWPNGLTVKRNGRGLDGIDVITQPYPGFPTDMQAQTMALAATAKGASLITETIFENRFMHVPELSRMGANITVHGGSAMVRGVSQLTGAPVMATDLRASVSLLLAGLAARGETIIKRVYHLDRGYERIEAKLSACGAEITRERDS